MRHWVGCWLMLGWSAVAASGPISSAALAKDILLVGPPTTVQQQEILVYPRRDWATTVTTPRTGPGEHLVLILDERLVTAGSGGC